MGCPAQGNGHMLQRQKGQKAKATAVMFTSRCASAVMGNRWSFSAGLRAQMITDLSLTGTHHSFNPTPQTPKPASSHVYEQAAVISRIYFHQRGGKVAARAGDRQDWQSQAASRLLKCRFLKSPVTNGGSLTHTHTRKKKLQKKPLHAEDFYPAGLFAVMFIGPLQERRCISHLKAVTSLRLPVKRLVFNLCLKYGNNGNNTEGIHRWFTLKALRTCSVLFKCVHFLTMNICLPW